MKDLFHIARREPLDWWKKILVRIGAVLVALLICSVFLYAVTKMNPIEIYKAMFKGNFGSNRKVWILIRDTMTLLLFALALAPAFKMKFWNIGAEGQALIGGVITAGLMIALGNKLPTSVMLLIMFAASALGGALWGLIPAIFKAVWKTNETLFTLMMNYIALQITSYCVALWENPFGSNSVGVINQKTGGGWFPTVFGQSFGLNVIIVLALTVVMFFYLKKSKQGYEISVVGESENTARYSGISVKKVLIRTMLISGAICGIAGCIIVGGIDHTISTTTAGGRGFTAIIVAWMAGFNPFIMIPISVLLVFLNRGAAQVASTCGLNEYASDIVTAVILLCILASEFFLNYRILFGSGKKVEAAAVTAGPKAENLEAEKSEESNEAATDSREEV
ncbi:MAG: ABC transporter permease [Lachnospiraceae bacterium]|nr:ABC transporter permease [Lachnospiraceae bacterium]